MVTYEWNNTNWAMIYRQKHEPNTTSAGYSLKIEKNIWKSSSKSMKNRDTYVVSVHCSNMKAHKHVNVNIDLCSYMITIIIG